MSDWSWVVLGYAVAYGALAVSVSVVLRGWVRARRGMEEQR